MAAQPDKAAFSFGVILLCFFGFGKESDNTWEGGLGVPSVEVGSPWFTNINDYQLRFCLNL